MRRRCFSFRAGRRGKRSEQRGVEAAAAARTPEVIYSITPIAAKSKERVLPWHRQEPATM